ncbi:MAG: hypothetical protein HYS81_01925 [Candidatus Aenigmatarchaeota archaeon]|nr:MAG: hypothetical protein HYS81_01925 [Candidatus Aenigmarchaeota archaeon]
MVAPKHTKDDVDSYREAVLANIVFKKYLKEIWNVGYDLYFGARLVYDKDKPAVTPDLFLKGTSSNDIVGDIKRSLPSNFPNSLESKNYMEWARGEGGKGFVMQMLDVSLTQKLKKYDSEFLNCTNPHDILFILHERAQRTYMLWKRHLPYIPRNNLVGLQYHVSRGSSVKTLNIGILDGQFSDQGLGEFFRDNPIAWHFNEESQLIGEYKIAVVDEGHQPPKEYVMLILWQNIFDEILRNKYSESLLDRVKILEQGLNPVIVVDLDTIIEYLSKYYILPYYDTADNSQDTRRQFTRSLVKDAMNSFTEIDITDVTKVDGGTNPAYKIVYQPLSKGQDALQVLIDALSDAGILEKEVVDIPRQIDLTSFTDKDSDTR